eukprot:CAMPEP_0119323030 /NCGR_PEP_ID=MMETSP1333-20130426/59783_1 /TAXON_ID=418940 /ORGANISM="Scyphosphaera apsteinii, Strain RCC1455" /LENGTH=33 /DNA_ID= /DNA_START= /DNA_END= /DNA_ORIENTATION=
MAACLGTTFVEASLREGVEMASVAAAMQCVGHV